MDNKFTPELTEEEIQMYADKAEALAKEKGVSKVHVVVQINPETLERSACYLKEPNYPTKLAVLDKYVKLGIYLASDELREACVIREASDAITYGDSPECDRFKIGITDYCMGIITKLQNQFKKK